MRGLRRSRPARSPPTVVGTFLSPLSIHYGPASCRPGGPTRGTSCHGRRRRSHRARRRGHPPLPRVLVDSRLSRRASCRFATDPLTGRLGGPQFGRISRRRHRVDQIPRRPDHEDVTVDTRAIRRELAEAEPLALDTVDALADACKKRLTPAGRRATDRIRPRQVGRPCVRSSRDCASRAGGHPGPATPRRRNGDRPQRSACATLPPPTFWPRPKRLRPDPLPGDRHRPRRRYAETDDCTRPPADVGPSRQLRAAMGRRRHPPRGSGAADGTASHTWAPRSSPRCCTSPTAGRLSSTRSSPAA